MLIFLLLNYFLLKVLENHVRFDFKKPMPECSSSSIREIIHQGPLKLKELSKTKPIDVQGFLFTDMLLLTKENREKKGTKRYKIIKPPIRSNFIVINELKDEKGFLIIQKNVYDIAEAVYVLQTPHFRRWIESLNEAKVRI